MSDAGCRFQPSCSNYTYKAIEKYGATKGLWLGLKRIPKKSTFHDWLMLFNTKLIREFIELSIDKSNLKVVAIDGSGIQTNFQSPYYQKRLNELGQKLKNSYHKLDIIVDVYGKKQILDYSFW